MRIVVERLGARNDLHRHRHPYGVFGRSERDGNDHVEDKRNFLPDGHDQRLASVIGRFECLRSNNVSTISAKSKTAARRRSTFTEGGFTLLEAVMTMALTLVSLPLVLPVVNAVEHGAKVGSAQSFDNTMIAATLIPLSNEISSAAVVYSSSPSSGTNYATQDTGTSAGDALIVLSQAGGGYRCDQWAISTAGELEDRSWVPSSSTATPFIPVSAAVYPPASTPFILNNGTPPSIQLALSLKQSSSTIPITVDATISATNVGSSTLATDCETAPAT
jgi:hypothetical protein